MSPLPNFMIVWIKMYYYLKYMGLKNNSAVVFYAIFDSTLYRLGLI